MMKDPGHFEDDAELYALGLFEENERTRLDAHAARCRQCAQRLGRAEATVASMVDARLANATAPAALRDRVPVARHVARRNSFAAWATWRAATVSAAAAAAALAITAGSLAHQNAELRSSVDADGAAFGALVRSHFSHAQFVSRKNTPIDAKVVYERHGEWYEVLASGIEPDTRVAAVRAGVGVLTPLSANFARRGSTFILALRGLGPVSELRIIDVRGRTIARVHPALRVDAK